jgi:hypothetical protein
MPRKPVCGNPLFLQWAEGKPKRAHKDEQVINILIHWLSPD